jgi:hypothetical protein
MVGDRFQLGLTGRVVLPLARYTVIR